MLDDPGGVNDFRATGVRNRPSWTCTRRDRMRFELATQTDDAELRRLLRETPIEGRIRVRFEREPNSFHAAAIGCDACRVIVARDDRTGRITGMGSCSVMDAFVNGVPTRVGYLGQLRVHPAHRGNPRMVLAGYARLRELHERGLASRYVTTIIEDNLPARRLLESGVRGLPDYRRLDRLVTLIIPVRPGRRSGTTRRAPGVTVERGAAAALDEVIACLQRNGRRHQFTPCWTAEHLRSDERTRGLGLEDVYVARRGGEVVGCIALWDQRGFKQSVVDGYAGWLGVLRPLLNRTGQRLPRPGGALQGAFVSHVGIDDDDPGVLLDLMDAAHDDAGAAGLDHLVIGFSGRHPMLDAVRRAHGHREYPSILYAVEWDRDPGAGPDLDGRVPHLEMAIL